MKEYDVIAFGTGSAMNIISEVLRINPNLKVAVIENGPVGGICLTRGCIPSKIILYPAKLLAEIRRAKEFGINADIKGVDFEQIMESAYEDIMEESAMIERGIGSHPNIDLYRTTGTFVGEYTVDVGGELIRGEKILLCTGSRPLIPPIKGLKEAGYVTSDDFFAKVRKLPKSVAVIGGGFIGLELGFFLASMGSKVTIIEMLPRVAYAEEPEISQLLEKELSKIMNIYTNYKVVEVEKRGGEKILHAEHVKTGESLTINAEEILVAAGRASNSDITKPEKTGVKTDKRGWIITNEYLETTKENIWACGDANGKYLFKHKANYESIVVLNNAFLGRREKVDYHAVPHAIFTHPEVGSVGMLQSEAEKKYGKDNILVGYYKYENTAMGQAMKVKDYFVKVIVKRDDYKILGAHIIGPQASILIQEVINLMYTHDQSAIPIYRGMHIHPALSEVVERAFYSVQPVE